MRSTWKGCARTRMWKPSLPQNFVSALLAAIRAASRASDDSCDPATRCSDEDGLCCAAGTHQGTQREGRSRHTPARARQTPSARPGGSRTPTHASRPHRKCGSWSLHGERNWHTQHRRGVRTDSPQRPPHHNSRGRTRDTAAVSRLDERLVLLVAVAAIQTHSKRNRSATGSPPRQPASRW